MSGIDDLVAIDVHTHPQTEEFLAAMGQRHQQMAKHFGRERPVVSFAEQADQYRDRRMMAVIVNSDSETTSGIKGAPNDLLGQAQVDHPDVFLAFAGIDPWKGEAAISTMASGLSVRIELRTASIPSWVALSTLFTTQTCAILRFVSPGW